MSHMGAADEHCEDSSKSWEDDTYDRFSCPRFFVMLRDADDYRSKIALPRKFCDTLKGRIPETVILRGPSGARFSVKLTRTTTNGFLLDDGWGEFVESYSLRESDMLILKYDGIYDMDALIFNSEDQYCEKVSSYFVRKCGHSNSETVSQRKWVLRNTTGDDNGQEVNVGANANPDSESKRQRVSKEADIEVKVYYEDENETEDSAVKDDCKHICHDSEETSTRVSKEANTKVQISREEEDDVGKDGCNHNVAARNASKDSIGDLTSNAEAAKLQDIHEPSKDDNSSDAHKINESRPRRRCLVKFPNLSPSVIASSSAVDFFRSQPIGLRFYQNDLTNEFVAFESPPAPASIITSFSDASSRAQPVSTNTVNKISSKSCAIRRRRPSLTDQEVESGGMCSNRTSITITEEDKAVVLQRARSEVDAKSFIQVMRPYCVVGQNCILRIPIKWFARNLPCISQDVVLAIDGNRFAMTLKYYDSQRTGVLCKGWEHFVVEFGLKEYDVCLFKLVSQNKPSVFNVSIFRVSPNPNTNTSTAAALMFGGICSNRTSIAEEDKAMTLQIARSKVDANSFISVMRPYSVNCQNCMLIIPQKWFTENLRSNSQHAVLAIGENRFDMTLSYCSSRRTGVLRTGWKNFVVELGLKELDVILFKLTSQNKPVVFDVTILFRAGTDPSLSAAATVESGGICSNRTPITEEDKAVVLQSARSQVDAKSFISVMRPSCVFGQDCMLEIPLDWFAKNLPCTSQDVFLAVGENRFSIALSYCDSLNTGVLQTGWKDFVVEFGLKEFDVCLFKLVSQSNPTVFDVSIFRVDSDSALSAAATLGSGLQSGRVQEG